MNLKIIFLVFCVSRTAAALADSRHVELLINYERHICEDEETRELIGFIVERHKRKESLLSCPLSPRIIDERGETVNPLQTYSCHGFDVLNKDGFAKSYLRDLREHMRTAHNQVWRHGKFIVLPEETRRSMRK